MKNLFYRIITGAVLLPIVIYGLFSSKASLAFLLGLIGLIAALEIATIVSLKKPLRIFLACSAWAMILIPIISGANQTWVMGCLIILFILWNSFFLFSKKFSKNELEKSSLALYFMLYTFIGLISCYLIRSHSIERNPNIGISFILLGLISTWSNDACAYFGGRAFGKRPLFSSVSAKKTWEGVFAGSLGSLSLVFIIQSIFQAVGIEIFYLLTVTDILMIVIPSFIFAPLGDLIESRLKRLYDVKDSSNILPGHGGIFDRIDSLLLVMPWVYLYAFIIRPIW